jgi:hypothetical protein
MKIQLVMEYSDDKENIRSVEKIGRVHEVYGSIGLWLECMYVDTNISFWYSEGEHRTEWKKEIGTYSRIRAVIIEK